MKAHVGRIVRGVITVAIVALLVVFARKVDWAATWDSMRHASLPLLAVAATVNLASIIIKGVRWWLFLRAAGSRSLGLAIRATAAGAGLNNVLVANGGDAARVVFVTRASGLPGSTVLASMALERVFDSIGFLLILAVAAFALPLPSSFRVWRIPAAILAVAALGLLAWLARSRPDEAVADVGDVVLPEGAAWRTRGAAFARRFASSARSLATVPRFAGALALSMLAWWCQYETFALVASAAHAPLPPAGNLAALLATNAGLIVRATPGNVGVFQAAYAVAAGAFDVVSDRAIGVAFLIQALQIIPTTLLGVILAPEFVFRRGARESAA